jgi:hypothetical protein
LTVLSGSPSVATSRIGRSAKYLKIRPTLRRRQRGNRSPHRHRVGIVVFHRPKTLGRSRSQRNHVASRRP